jgi:hypothetical protein
LLETAGEVIGPPYRPRTGGEPRLAGVFETHGTRTRETRLLLDLSSERSKAKLEDGPRGGTVWGRTRMLLALRKRKIRSRENGSCHSLERISEPVGFNWLRRLAVDTSCCNCCIPFVVVGTLSLPDSWDRSAVWGLACFAGPGRGRNCTYQGSCSAAVSRVWKVGFSKLLSEMPRWSFKEPQRPTEALSARAAALSSARA